MTPKWDFLESLKIIKMIYEIDFKKNKGIYNLKLEGKGK